MNDIRIAAILLIALMVGCSQSPTSVENVNDMEQAASETRKRNDAERVGPTETKKGNGVERVSSIETKKGDGVAQVTPSESNNIEIGRIETALSLWKSSKTDDAVKYLVRIGNASEVPPGPEESLFRLSEGDVAKLSQDERKAFQSNVIKLVPLVKALGTKCAAEGSELLKNKNVSDARKYFEATKRLGQTLAAPERVQILHSIGKSLVKLGDDGLAECNQISN